MLVIKLLTFGKRKIISNLTVAKKPSRWRHFGQKTHCRKGDIAQIFKEKKTTLAKINGIGDHVLKH